MKAIVTLIYKPFGLILGVASGFVAKKIFDFVWSKIDEEEPPDANTEKVSWPKLIGAMALQGVIWKLVRTVVDRGTAKSFAYVTGVWPGERRPEQA